MAKAHGRHTYISLDGDDLSQFTNASELERNADSHDITGYGASGHTFEGGLTNGTASMSGIYDNLATGPRAVIEPLVGSVVEMVRRPDGTGATKAQDTADVLVLSYTETNPVADMVAWACELQVSGAIDSTPQGA